MPGQPDIVPGQPASVHGHTVSLGNQTVPGQPASVPGQLASATGQTGHAPRQPTVYPGKNQLACSGQQLSAQQADKLSVYVQCRPYRRHLSVSRQCGGTGWEMGSGRCEIGGGKCENCHVSNS